MSVCFKFEFVGIFGILFLLFFVREKECLFLGIFFFFDLILIKILGSFEFSVIGCLFVCYSFRIW